ncbi:MAG: hypothetical protein WB820_06865 [Rhodoplanes sp.]
MREIKNAKPLQRAKHGRFEGGRRAIGQANDFDRRRLGDGLALGMRAPFLGGANDGRAEAEGREFIFQRLGVMERYPLRNCVPVVRTIQKAENAIAQVLISAVEDDLPIVAGAVEAVNGRVDRADVELPTALEEIGNLVEQQSGVTAIHLHPLAAKAAPFADQCHDSADGAQRRDGKVVGLDDRVDIARGLLDMNCVRQPVRQSQSLGDCRENLPLSIGVHSPAPWKENTDAWRRCPTAQSAPKGPDQQQNHQ